MNETNPIPDESQLQAPQGLASDLARLYRTGVSVPADVDASLGETARRHFAGARRRRSVARWLWAAAAAAAVLVIIFWPSPIAERQPFDVNSDGRVDILDAFALEAAIEQRETLSPAWDVNGDGVVDRADVDRIGYAAVSLHERTVR